MRRDVHILRMDERWTVMVAGNEEACFESQYDAEGFGRRIAREEASKIFVHECDGMVSRKDDYARDGQQRGWNLLLSS